MKKNKDQRNSTLGKVKGKTTDFIAAAIHKVQSGWANWMTNMFSKFSVKTNAVFFAVYLLATFLVSCYLIAGTFRQDTITQNRRNDFQLPHLQRSGTENRAAFIPKELYKRIHTFRLSMDSLMTTPQGEKKRDSILSKRPHLMDSINRIEKLYQLRKDD